jgi:hypothetical protein
MNIQGGLKINPHDFSDTSDSGTKKCFKQMFISFQSTTNLNIFEEIKYYIMTILSEPNTKNS